MSVRLTMIAGALLVSGLARGAPPLEVYGRLPGVDLVALSPSGDRYAMVAVVGDARKLVVIGHDGKVLSASGTGTAKVRGIHWAGENHLLVSLDSTFRAPLDLDQAYELMAIANVDLTRNSARPIFDRMRSVADAVFGYFGTAEVDGHLFGYFGGVTYEHSSSGAWLFDHGYPDLYRTDLDSMETTRVALGNEDTHGWVVSNQGVVVAHAEYAEKERRWRLYAGGERRRTLAERDDPGGNVGLIGQGRSPGTVVLVDDTGDKDLVTEVLVADGGTQELFSDVSVLDYLYDRDTKQLIGALTPDEPRATFFDPSLSARFQAARKAFPGMNAELVSYSRRLDRMIVKTEGNADSGTYWLVDISSGKADVVARPYPLIRDADVAETRTYHYAAADGLPIEAILTLPPGREARNLPLVVLPHGGPIGVRDVVRFDWWAQAYASRGYAVLQPNYRGSTGYGRTFRQAGYGQWGRKMQTDLSDGVAALAKDGTIDPKRACIVGASYGGYAALAGVTLQHGVYRCAVAVAGPADLPAFFAWQADRHGERSGATRYWRAVLGADKAGDAVMASLSPTEAAARTDAPVLLIHGRDDTVVPVEQSESMAAALKRAGKPYEYLVMKGEDHWLSREATRVEMLNAAVAFVQKYNPADGS